MQKPGGGGEGGAPDRRQQLRDLWSRSMSGVSRELRGTTVAAAECSRGRGVWRPGWVHWPLLWLSWKPLEVWGIEGGAWSDFSPITQAAVLRIDSGRGQGGGQEAVARERWQPGQADSGGSGEQWADASWILKEEPTGFANGLDVEKGTLGSPQALAGWVLISLGSFNTPLPGQKRLWRQQLHLGLVGPRPSQGEACMPLGSALPYPGWETGQAFLSCSLLCPLISAVPGGRAVTSKGGGLQRATQATASQIRFFFPGPDLFLLFWLDCRPI